MRPQLARPVDAGNPEPLDFEDLVRRHQAMVFSIAFHFLQDRAAAEELAQDVFLQLSGIYPASSRPSTSRSGSGRSRRTGVSTTRAAEGFRF